MVAEPFIFIEWLIVDFYCGTMGFSLVFSTLFLRTLNTSFTFVMTTDLIVFMEVSLIF